MKIKPPLAEQFYKKIRSRMTDKESDYKNWFKEFDTVDPIGFKELIYRAFSYNRVQKKMNKITKEFPKSYQNDLFVFLAEAEIKRHLIRSFEFIDASLKTLQETNWIVFIGAGLSFETDVGNATLINCLSQVLKINEDKIRLEYIKKGLNLTCWNKMNKSSTENFKQIFSNYVKRQIPGRSHELIKKIIESNKIEQLVCFNWDDLIERGECYPVLIGNEPIKKLQFHIWKPHGSVTFPQEKWIFPPQVKLSGEFNSYIKANPGVRVSISIGFSGGEDFSEQHIKDLLGQVLKLDIRPIFEAERKLGKLLSLTAAYALYWLCKKVLNINSNINVT